MPAFSAELLMFEQAGCPFCRKFDTEIAPDYPNSRIGKIAPLRRVNIFADRRGGIAGLTPAVFTPTFVLIGDDGHEIGRLEGYPGRRWFYPEIEQLLKRRPFDRDQAAGRIKADTPKRSEPPLLSRP
ncbi:thioredoxin family protein [Jiella sp. MQZ9-1]|uniref:Thioredoxin family protein n=1 Tax=Jiella flava TaxID=2816857 RepID=A0A939FX49_9HYPH|nr:thioredoxin family protein [Jiella flava]MBO0663608.1 thioredoxin family protein [Jiella flava]MCD2472183.1 thioredoxin family protein [Jiella flava]